MAEIERGDRLVLCLRPHAEAVAGIHHQRRADDQQRIGRFERLRRERHALARHVFAEEHDRRLQQPAARGARRNAERVERGPFEVRVAIRGRLGLRAQQFGIVGLEHDLDRRARMMRAAAEARDAVDSAVQFNDVAAARALVQAVDVLRDETLDPSRVAEPRQRHVRPVRPRAADDGPADHAARPIAPPRGIGAEEFV